MQGALGLEVASATPIRNGAVTSAALVH